ncbi:HD domain-containing protein [Desulfovibrio sp. ZJ200]|uniref:HD domain-containing protein n=1 Tax=Desulfovibrio sp. ZJ200 TaxID=2709792 RepID=UPI0013EBD31E|nr:HD domain-containing protein [Desulfovibrio sp. ZJ200]
MNSDISLHEQWFAGYAARKRARELHDAAPLDLKAAHTRAVLENARRMALHEKFEPPLARACLLAALYHDLGRFEQYLRFHTFRDRESCNHGLLGVKILKREARLAGEDARTRKTVLAAVGLHNRFALPAHLPRTVELAAHVVRDADKLDILRIIDEHLSGPGPCSPTVVLNLPDDPALSGEAVLRAAAEGRVAAYADLRSVNDFRVLLGTWFFDMHFATSRRQFVEDGHARRLLEALPPVPPYGPARAALLERLSGAERGAPGSRARA